MTMNSPVQDQNLPVYSSYPPEDHISLVDIWLMLLKYRLVLIGISVTCVLVGFLYAELVPRSYQYSTSIEIAAHIGVNELGYRELIPIESPETVLAKVKGSYIPLVRQNYLKKHSELKSVVNIDARIPRNSQIVVLSSNGAESEGDIHRILQQSVVNLLKEDHSRIIDVLRKELGDLQDQVKTKLGNPLVSLSETHALLPPMRSLEPKGLGKASIIPLSLVLGLMLGVFAAFVAEFFSRVRNQLKSEQNA